MIFPIGLLRQPKSHREHLNSELQSMVLNLTTLQITWRIKNSKTRKQPNKQNNARVCPTQSIVYRISGSTVQGAVIPRPLWEMLMCSQHREPEGQDYSLAVAARVFVLLWVQGKVRSHFHSSQLRLFAAALSPLGIPVISSHSSRSQANLKWLQPQRARLPQGHGISSHNTASKNAFKGSAPRNISLLRNI